MPFIPILVLLQLSPAVSRALSTRDFDLAMELASGAVDSAAVHSAAGRHAAAAAVLSREYALSGSGEAFSMMWEEIVLDIADGHAATTGTPGAELRAGLAGFRGVLDAGAMSSLAGSASALGDAALSDSLTRELAEAFPGSTEAGDLIGSVFWERIYPVWDDDSAKVAAIEGFLADYGACSPVWRSRAHQYLVAAVLGTADSTGYRDRLGAWLEDCPGDPLPCLTAAALLIDRDSLYWEALAQADEGIRRLGAGWRPEGLRPGETALILPALEVDLRFRRAQALLGMGMAGEALACIDSALAPAPFDIDDWHSHAACSWLRGTILREGGLEGWERAWIESCMAGDPDGRWSARARKDLEEALSVDAEAFGRELHDWSGPVFVDATGLLQDSGGIPGGRVSWADFDGDSWPDLLLGGRLYRNLGGDSFEDVTSALGLEGLCGSGGVFADMDGDGRPDIVTAGPSPVLLSNRPEGFSRAWERGPFDPESSAEGVGILDWDGDGLEDIYLAFYEAPGTLGEGTQDMMLLQRQDGTFDEEAGGLGMVPFLDIPLCGRGVSPCDFDRDGDMDVFVSNYRLEENLLWLNEDGLAVPAALETRLAGVEKEGWWGHTIGSAWADFDNDGDWDLFSANLAHPRYIDISDRSMLLVNDGGAFTDERAARGIRYEETHSVPVWGDFDCDGLLDLYITSVYEGRRSFLYVQEPDGTFTDATFLSGTRVMNGWGAAAADFDRDGRLDLAVGSGSGSRLFRNVSAPGHWLLVEISAGDGSYPAMGAVVEVEQDGIVQMRQVQGGSGTSCQDGALLHFGLPRGGSAGWRLYLPGSSAPAASGITDEVDRIISIP